MAKRISCRARRGSTMTFSIVVSVVMSGLIASMAWVAGESSQRTGSLSKMDQAFFAAEAGSSRVAWYVRNAQMSSITSPLTGTVNGYNYSVSWTSTYPPTYSVTSIGSSGNVRYTLSQTMVGAGSPPVLTVLGNFDNKNVDITGTALVGGSYSNSGSGSLIGDLIYYVNVTDVGNISGSVTKGTGSVATVDLSALGTSLIATATAEGAAASYSGAQSNKTFNFTTLSGTNKVIYVNGDVTNPTFVGTGTLYVAGKITLGGAGTTSALPVNLVATSDVTFTNNISYYGSVYAGGNWSHSKSDTVGMVYVVGSTVLTGTGHSTLTQTTAPWFDTRSVGSGTGATAYSNFAGPQP